MNAIETIFVTDWQAPVAPATAAHALDALEAGSVLRLPLPFVLQADEQSLLSPTLLSGARKNISYNPANDRVQGADGEAALEAQLRGFLGRYHRSTRTLIEHLFAPYAAQLIDGRTSYRPAEIAGRVPKSWRHDDTRLHVDAFPATPVHGRRLLRVFNNINPHGEPRRWRVGEPFADVAARFAPRAPKPSSLKSALMAATKITKSRRSGYDHYMLQLHDGMKADLAYQAQVPKTPVEFAPGETWIVYSDQVSHAVLSGRYMLEQTFYVPVAALQYPERSPLKVLEAVTGRALV
ncbi:Kdo hydroxylase family protein [Solimonas marina]|uniref:3-deoxy-D-manno-oct-2-ulosonic acid (Kdo) hydroxylase n=1 Tax=Solimonas marina TaxID=2714601 RepID=A0A969W763_9GAMM|nr:Kdo hydroxylase family protein [Solimonas marina]NKF21657.1 3-deoxy-D-manno-oct-2-ulosonic acid (Kdo) hydroxylase [Solimonas marina]